MSPADLDKCQCGLPMVPITRGGAQAMPLYACPRCDLLPDRTRTTFAVMVAEEVARWEKSGRQEPSWRLRQVFNSDQVEPSRPYDWEKDGEA